MSMKKRHKIALIPTALNPKKASTPSKMKIVPKVTHFVDACSLLYISGSLMSPRQPKKLKAAPIPKRIIAATSLIEAPPFQIFGQGNRTDEAQQRPGYSHVDIETSSGYHAHERAEPNHNYPEDIDRHRSIGRGWPSTYSVDTHKTAEEENS
jgi:hypothetical protein